jgi:hypothetical protein
MAEFAKAKEPFLRGFRQDANEDELYLAMDWLLERKQRIEKKLAKRHLQKGSLVLYDVSSSYYEGHRCPLAKFGYGRDGKKGLPIILRRAPFNMAANRG